MKKTVTIKFSEDQIRYLNTLTTAECLSGTDAGVETILQLFGSVVEILENTDSDFSIDVIDISEL